jgi:hypothetical protein
MLWWDTKLERDRKENLRKEREKMATLIDKSLLGPGDVVPVPSVGNAVMTSANYANAAQATLSQLAVNTFATQSSAVNALYNAYGQQPQPSFGSLGGHSHNLNTMVWSDPVPPTAVATAPADRVIDSIIAKYKKGEY